MRASTARVQTAASPTASTALQGELRPRNMAIGESQVATQATPVAAPITPRPVPPGMMREAAHTVIALAMKTGTVERLASAQS